MDEVQQQESRLILCMGERDYFPASEFTFDADSNPLTHRPKELPKPQPPFTNGLLKQMPEHFVWDGSLVYPQNYPVGSYSAQDSEGKTNSRSYSGLRGSGPIITADWFEERGMKHSADVLAAPTLKKDKGAENETLADKKEMARYQWALDLEKARYQLYLDELKAEEDAQRQQIKDALASDYTSRQNLYSAHLDVIKGQIDRAQARAVLVIQAASAVGTIYAAILGLAFGLGNGQTRALPPRGAVSAFMLGGAILATAIYLGYIKVGSRKEEFPFSGLPSLRLKEELDNFTFWTTAIVIRRLPFLHMAVAFLGLGVLFLPIAFLQVSDLWALVVAAILAALVIVVVILVSLVTKSNMPSTNEQGSGLSTPSTFL